MHDHASVNNSSFIKVSSYYSTEHRSYMKSLHSVKQLLWLFSPCSVPDGLLALALAPASLPIPPRASRHAARSGCCCRSTWPAACPGRFAAPLALPRQRATPWKRCTPVEQRSGPGWPRPAACSHKPLPAAASEEHAHS